MSLGAGAALAALLTAAVLLATGTPAPAQFEDGYVPSPPEQDDGSTPPPEDGYYGNEYQGAPRNEKPPVDLQLTTKRKQRSLKRIKVKASCGERACTVRAKGKIKHGERRARLKPPKELLLGVGETGTLKLRIKKQSRKRAERVLRRHKRSRIFANVKARARAVGGGSSDTGKVKVRIKR